MPMCTTSGGSVIDSKFIYPFIYESQINKQTCTIKSESATSFNENDMDYQDITASATIFSCCSILLSFAISMLLVVNIV